MRQTFERNPILCDLILIRGALGVPAARTALEKIEQPVAALVAAGLSPQQALDTYTAISVLVRSSAVLQRLQTRTPQPELPSDYWEQVIDRDAMPLIASIPGRGYRIGDLLEALLGVARAKIRITVDPARLRPSDTAAVIGDPSRIAADVGWRAEIPIARTLEDLLDDWRLRVAVPRS